MSICIRLKIHLARCFQMLPNRKTWNLYKSFDFLLSSFILSSSHCRLTAAELLYVEERKLLFLTEASPREAGIIRAMETGNTSPSLSSSPSSLSPLDPHLFSLSLPPHLCHLTCAFICPDYQVQGLKSEALK